MSKDELVKQTFVTRQSYCPVVFMQDGTDPNKAKNILVDISKFIQKYWIQFPEGISKVP